MTKAKTTKHPTLRALIEKLQRDVTSMKEGLDAIEAAARRPRVAKIIDPSRPTEVGHGQ